MAGESLDLGGGYSLRFFSWAPDRELNPQYDGIPDVGRAGAIVTCPHDEGSIFFANEMPGDHLRWTVESWEPLTLSPSIVMPCGCHGFVHESKWVPA